MTESGSAAYNGGAMDVVLVIAIVALVAPVGVALLLRLVLGRRRRER